VTRRVSASLVVAVLVAGAAATLLGTGPDRTGTPTSFGTSGTGHGALYELLTALVPAVTRSFVPPERLGRGSSVWWVEPEGLCRAAADDGENVHGGRHDSRAEAGCLELGTWLVGGGVGVLFLDAAADGAMVAGGMLPERQLGEGAARAAQDRRARRADEPQVVRGELAAEPFVLALPPMASFAVLVSPEWKVVASLDGRPFVIERDVGAGRLVLVADAAFLRNAWLDRADAAPLAVALAARFGAPSFDEWSHGIGPDRSVLRFLAGSPAMPFLASAALLALLVAWHGAAIPPRRLAPQVDAAPSLDAYVRSLGSLYAASRDPGALLDRYRDVTAARLRRHFDLPAETTLESLVARVRARTGVNPAHLAVLERGLPVRRPAELQAALAALDRLTAEAAR
jgi:hypothetical protein